MANKRYLKCSLFFCRLVFFTLIVSVFFILIQTFLIFPGLYSSKFFGVTYIAPDDVDTLSTVSPDGHSNLVWRLKADDAKRKIIALIFHGNSENLKNFVQVQRWLQSLGISSYSVEYRGYFGINSGWPSEAGFYLDSEAAFQLVLSEEKIEPKDVLVLGSSIGTGTAGYVAQKFNVGTLVLLSPYTSLKNAAAETPLFGLLAPFIKYKFPTNEYIGRLTDTCVINAHGKKDSVISFYHSEALKQNYRGTSSYDLILQEDAGHNDLLLKAREQIEKSIMKCIS